MIKFRLNDKSISYSGDSSIPLIKYLRNKLKITSVKDGCSGQGACGACIVEIDGKAKLACRTKIDSLHNSEIFTLEGIPENIVNTIANAFVEKGAVQCGFCSPGFILRSKILLQNNRNPSQEEIKSAINPSLCRCTGYKKIIDAVNFSAISLAGNKSIENVDVSGKVGTSLNKFQAFETAVGKRKFVNDIFLPDMLFSALKFSDHPRAKILKIDFTEAANLEGVVRIFTAEDIPGKRRIGLIVNDWVLMIKEGETTNYIGDVLAGVVAVSEEIARQAIELIKIDYEILKPIVDVQESLKNFEKVHLEKSNVLENCIIKKGDFEKEYIKSEFVSTGFYETQRIEHAFLEFETAIAYPLDDGIGLLSQGQGIYEDRRQVAEILNIDEKSVKVNLVPNGGGFGGKEDLTVQGHVSLFAYLLKKPVKLSLSRDESTMMHPKRHPVFMNISVACDKIGKLTALKLRAIGDTGAYASVGTKVMERVAGHSTGGYFVPCVDIEAKTVYTNNIPSGAMRGFGANQVAFALESCIDELCEKGNFDRWKFRYQNALIDGLETATGQKLRGVGIRECLLSLKADFYKSKYVGLACGIKNSGIGNGMVDFCTVKIEIESDQKIIIHHGWTEMGQGVHNMAIQTFCQEIEFNPANIEIVVSTSSEIKTGMTTSSRATALVGNAIIEACKKIKLELKEVRFENLVGKVYYGTWACNWTTKPGDDVENSITHYSYGYAAQLCVLNGNGEIEKIIAAHDAGKVMNPKLFEGQIEGAVHMGIGYAISENLPMKDGKLLSTKLKDCGVLRAKDTPEICVIPVEVKDPVGPYGAKGIGEIGLVPTAAAIANAFCAFDGQRRKKLPMKISATK
ncbi:MAG: molybdopterin-dependent oxidoreductase [Bacteroidetes bacterium]|jgi:aldehyde oxidoreductase|nr:molybdopterin-dependent oxidoreductase [Bacteroidota bacterium]MBT6687025.1 molybdopterin-dependent oxidoreductase [Bacteroidota bacterium]MBT7145001.1 molybdopterin-dependent oxidoreductase [Bacteroidota bacterium]MBT7490113.1 molybdopterin-dependent oxidoreductase [Bacteroidota bacterium]